MPEFHGSASERIAARPDAVFDLITDINRLPRWNACIDHVVDKPADLGDGAEWVVKMHVPRMPKWDSRSTLVELNRDARRFVHRSQSDDGNPSYAIWTWEVTPVDGVSELTVRWEGHPETFWRRVLFSRIRG